MSSNLSAVHRKDDSLTTPDILGDFSNIRGSPRCPTEASCRRVPWLRLAFADDVHIISPPELAAAAYEKWRFLYAASLQGELNDSKSKCYSPKISAEAVRPAGMPTDVGIATDCTRVLGEPVGSPTTAAPLRRAWCRRSSRTSTSSVGCRPFRRSTALRWVQSSIGLIICGA